MAAVVGVCVVALVTAGVVAGVRYLIGLSEPRPAAAVPPPPAPPSCTITTSSGRVRLDPAQAANAATIAAVAKRMGLGDGAATVAFVAALQESKLHNVDYGDLDSLGLFQQRPSQGWGTPAQVMDPVYAASAFFNALVRVPGWEAMAVGDAAQQVQRSNGPDAYAIWAWQARMLTEAFTGHTGGALTCRFDAPASQPPATSLDEAATAALGAPVFDVPLPADRGWTVATWLVGHAYDFGISAVTFLGLRWTSTSGTWEATGQSDPVVRIEPR
jgi:hypothetical protein